ncbi:GAF domain-containing protein [Candidatus Leptofilum sp.]|uniref:GAF domain-containing protein n=1 Tax=Candidatus Leptofilum sp. TaxID=3241576 RepID=UPI003B5AEEBB
MIHLNRKHHSRLSPRLQSVLQQIVDDVVNRLGCLGALATTLENDMGLYVRASAFTVPDGRLQQVFAHSHINLEPGQAMMYLNNARHRYNLGVSAVNGATARVVNEPGHQHLLSERLYDLLRPLTDRATADEIQRELDISQVIAVPLVVQKEVVGAVMALTQDSFTNRDAEFLEAFGNLAASAIQNDYRLTAMESLERVIFGLQARMTDETRVLQTVVDAVVQELGYEGAMVATLENGNALPVRAYALDDTPQILTHLEKKAGMSLLSPKSVVFLDQSRYQHNLSVRAVKGIDGRPQKFLTSDHLHDLLRPFINKPLADFAQRMLGIRQVIAVPFFIEDEVVGNLFVASRRDHFTTWETTLLTTFGQQAAAGIRNARLYREAEEQRRIAALFGRMAFSSTAAVHGLGNDLSIISTYLQMLQSIDDFSDSQKAEMATTNARMVERIDKSLRLLDNLHEPWRHTPDKAVQVNDCLVRAVREQFPEWRRGDTAVANAEYSLDLPNGHTLTLTLSLANDLPTIHTAPDMLSEAFRVIIKNGYEAIVAKNKSGALHVASRLQAPNRLQILIRDSGVGIRPEDLPRIFELGWSSKKGKGMGFGLFWTRDFIHGLGGSIYIDSKPGLGTTFDIMLAVADFSTS